VLNERTYPIPDSCLTDLFPRSRAVVAYTVVHLVTPDCTRGVIDLLYHSRHNGRDRHYECDRGIKVRWTFVELLFLHYFLSSPGKNLRQCNGGDLVQGSGNGVSALAPKFFFAVPPNLRNLGGGGGLSVCWN